MPRHERYDLVVLGGGTGGLVSARLEPIELDIDFAAVMHHVHVARQAIAPDDSLSACAPRVSRSSKPWEVPGAQRRGRRRAAAALPRRDHRHRIRADGARRSTGLDAAEPLTGVSGGSPSRLRPTWVPSPRAGAGTRGTGRPPRLGAARARRRHRLLTVRGDRSRAAEQVALFGEAGRQACRRPVVRLGALVVAGHLQEVRAYRVQPVVSGESVLRV